MKFKNSIPYDILIRPTPNNAFIVEVGCVKLAYTGITTLIHDLTEYLENPGDVEKQYKDDIAKLDTIHLGPILPGIWGSSALERATVQMEAQQNTEEKQ